jgi:nicotinate phosphoribosyltransferase
MTQPNRWVDDASAALLTDVYELTMLQAYHAEGMNGRALFSLFFRRLPPGRNYLLACGLEDVLHYLESLRFTPEALDYLRRRHGFQEDFLTCLADFRFSGDVWALPEGTPVFPDEPLLEIEAPLPEAQLPETFAMNQIQLQTLLASKAARVVHAAAGRNVVDFGLRRMQGTDAGLKGARAFHVAGVTATSNVLAGQVYGIPVQGTMAHSYIQAHDDELEAFRAFTHLYPGTVLLVDTYDTLDGVRKVIALARELGEDFEVRAIRLDSGDLAELASASRALLDEAGLAHVGIFASGGLDEWDVAALLEKEAPIDGFGVGARMGVSQDAPYLDIAYKLTEYAGTGRTKLSPGKRTLPGRKQVFRIEEDGIAVEDVLAGSDEEHPGRPLLRKVMQSGRRLPPGEVDLEEARKRAASEISRLPERIRALEPAVPPYAVRISEDLQAATEWARKRMAG